MINSINQLIQNGVSRNLLQNITEPKQTINSAEIALQDQKPYINFGSCSYLGLEFHPTLKNGIKAAVDQYGTQFSTSRTYLSIGQYQELEQELQTLFGQPAIVTASTTLGHLACLPIVVEEGDIVILDLQVHSSVQMTTQLLKANKVPVHLIPHNDMRSLEQKIKRLSDKANRIWYLADGVYSMYGDYAPLKELEKLMNKYKKLHLYIDDAHGMGWTGERGMGYVRSQIAHHPKMILATSLNKSFACSGGVLLFPNEELYRRVKNCGTTLIFSGPIQPPMLGGAIASAQLHQSEEIYRLQAALKEKIAYTNRRLKELDIPQYYESDSPIFFIPVGLPNTIFAVMERMRKRGFFLNSAGFPATPIKRGGLRFMITNNLSIFQIDAMLSTLREEYVLGLADEGSSPAKVAKTFRIPSFMEDIQIDKVQKEALQIQLHSSISALKKEEWDTSFAAQGSNTYHKLSTLEKVFNSSQEKKENCWEFHYQEIRDKDKTLVFSAVYSISLMKEDMLAEEHISTKLKELRKEDPYYLTSSVLMTGTPFTKGKSLYINYQHPQWKEALAQHLNQLQKHAEQANVSKIMLRDFITKEKDFLQDLMRDKGFLVLDLPNNCVVDLQWQSRKELLAQMTQKYRYSLRREILRKEGDFHIVAKRPDSKELKRKTYALYRAVQDRSTSISVFPLPYELFEQMYADEHYDFLYLYLKDNKEAPVAVMISERIGETYHAQLVGLDYTYVRSHSTYKQMLFQTVQRAKNLGHEQVDLAFTAEMEKKKVGARIEAVHAFVQALEHDSFAEMQVL